MTRIKKRSNLRDVAKLAGVSVATVSRVLNGTASVNKETRARVDAAIDSLNFVPSAAARAMNSGRSRILGALIPTLDHTIYARFLNALEHGLAQHGLSLVVATTEADADVEYARARSLLDLGVEGLVVSGITHSPDFEALVARRNVPVVATSYYDPGYHLPTIGYDNHRAGQVAYQHLKACGYNTIALLHGPAAQTDRTRARLAGIGQAAGGALRALACDIRLDAAGAALRHLLAEGRPDALLCLSDVLAQGALFECQRLGLSVPEDLALMGIDDLPSSAHVTPALSTVHLPVARMGKMAAEALAEWVETGTRPQPRKLEAHIITRQTTRPPYPAK